MTGYSGEVYGSRFALAERSVAGCSKVRQTRFALAKHLVAGYSMV